MRVSLDAELERFVRAQVKSGQYLTPEQVIRGALHVLKDQERWIASHTQQLKKAVSVGLAELERGEGEPWNVREIKAEGRRMRAARARSAASGSRARKRKQS